MSRAPQPLGAVFPPLSARGAPRKGPPGHGASPAASADPGSGLWKRITRPFPKVEEPLPSHVCSSRSRLVLAHPGSAAQEDKEEEDLPGGLAHLAQVDKAYLGMSCCLCTPALFWGLVRPVAPDPARGAFSYWAGWNGVARQHHTLHGLLRHQHCLRLARHYSCRLKAASDFVCRLMAAECCLLLPIGGQTAGGGRLLKELCQELVVHTSHWDRLQCHMRRDPWLGPLLLRQPEAAQCMKQSFFLLALHALRLLESCLVALLQNWACGPPAFLSEVFQGLESYNQGLSEWTLHGAELEPRALGQQGLQRARAFSVERVLAILAAERGRLAGERLSLLLPGQQVWTSDLEPTADGPSGAGDSLPAHLQALCQEEEVAVTVLLRELLASAGGLGHHLLQRPKQEKPPGPPDAAQGPGPTPLPSWKSPDWQDASLAEAAALLYAEYRPFFWRAASTSLVRQLELCSPLAQFQEGAGAALGRRLTHALEDACLPPVAAEELKDVALCLLKRDALWQWDPGFCRALGTSLVDKCLPKPTTVACSQTGRCLQSLFLLLASRMRCLDAQPFHSDPGGRLAPASLHQQLLSLVVATSHASSYWAMSKAYQYLASWSLSQFLLVTQGDLQLLKTEARKMLVLVSTAFLGDRWKQSPLASHWERELSLQVHSAATSIQLFANDVLELFSLDCRQVSAGVFRQSMPLGKYWRLALQAVLQGLQWLSRDAQALVLSQVTTAFLDVWMDHILAQKIKFSLQGALQLKRDFDVVRDVVQLDDYELSAEMKQLVFSLRAFQQVDNAIACLVQQPSKAALPLHRWDALHKCCPRDGMRSWDGSPGSLSSLEHLEGLPVHARAAPESWAADLLSHAPGGASSSETYLSLAQQEWLALRLHGGRRWRMPAFSCMNKPSEP
ncbi:coiled-coil domain-containing protein 142 isoform X2 [Candoia aspera]|uniref:coiled-coil domain-containing protein 142 isoform X2 n=1 Tax=Candoia aspera TaxID=51853 RepID=UPI002FD7AC48